MVGPGAHEDVQAYQQMRDWILVGRSDEEIAHALMLSVKVVRLVRRDVEAEVRPR